MPGEDYQSWSTTTASNGTADSAINWAEGQSRASVNNSSRAEMAAHAKNRNLLSGSIVTGGTASAQTFTSGVSYTTIPTGLQALLKIGTTLTSVEGTPTTLNMDGIGDINIKNQRDENVEEGLIAGTYARFIYNGTNWIWIESEILSIANTSINTIINNFTTVIVSSTTVDTTSGPVALVDFTDLDTTEFQYYEIMVSGFLPEIAGAILVANVSTDNGVTFPLDVEEYNAIEMFSSQQAVIGGDYYAYSYEQNDKTFLALTWSITDLTAQFPCNVKMTLFGFEAAISPVIHWDNSYYAAGAPYATISTGRGHARTTTGANAIRVWCNEGNITKARITLVGHRLTPPEPIP
jgi:hypothetical protein